MAIPSFEIVGGYKFPAVGFGTFTITDEKDLEEALDVALETGYRHIDTAYIYENEHIIGRVLKKWFDSGKLKREDIFITTKLPANGVNPDRVEHFLQTSLKNLQLDYVDLYLIHFPVCLGQEGGDPEPTDHISTWKKLEEQVDAGRTKAIGLSNFNKDQVKRIIENSRIKPAANQVELHVYLQQPELVKYCQENGVVVTSYFSLGNPGLVKWIEKRGAKPSAIMQNVIILEDAAVKRIADRHNKSPAQVLLKYLLQKNISVIPKSITATRIKENINLFDFTLDGDDLSALEALDQGEKGRRGRFDMNPAYLKHPEYPFKAAQ